MLSVEYQYYAYISESILPDNFCIGPKQTQTRLSGIGGFIITPHPRNLMRDFQDFLRIHDPFHLIMLSATKALNIAHSNNHGPASILIHTNNANLVSYINALSQENIGPNLTLRNSFTMLDIRNKLKDTQFYQPGEFKDKHRYLEPIAALNRAITQHQRVQAKHAQRSLNPLLAHAHNLAYEAAIERTGPIVKKRYDYARIFANAKGKEHHQPKGNGLGHQKRFKDGYDPVHKGRKKTPEQLIHEASVLEYQ